MKKILAILLAAGMIMPVTAYAATGEDPEEQTEDASDSAEEESLEEAIDNALSALQDLRDEWSSTVGGSEDAEEEEEESGRHSIRERSGREEAESEEEAGEEEEEASNEEYAAYDVIIEGILEDIADTVDGLKAEWDAAFEEVEDLDDLSDEEFEDTLSDWLDTCAAEVEDLMDRTNAASRDFLRMVVPDTDGDDAALEDALSYYSGALIDGTLEILYDAIVGDVLDAAYNIVDEFIEDWDPEDWDTGDWDLDDWDLYDWDSDDWDSDDWGSDYWDDYDWGPEEWDIEEWDALTGLLDWWEQFGESIEGDQDGNSRPDLQSIFDL